MIVIALTSGGNTCALFIQTRFAVIAWIHRHEQYIQGQYETDDFHAAKINGKSMRWDFKFIELKNIAVQVSMSFS